jgi:hypothetical protein
VAAASPHWGRDRQGWAGKQIITCFPPSDYEIETADIKSRLLSLSLPLLLRRHWPLIRGLSKLVQLSSPNDCDSTVGLCWHGTETSGLHSFSFAEAASCQGPHPCSLYPSGSIQELTGQAQMTYVQRANWRTSRGVVLLINPYPFALCIMPFDQLVRPPVV